MEKLPKQATFQSTGRSPQRGEAPYPYARTLFLSEKTVPVRALRSYFERFLLGSFLRKQTFVDELMFVWTVSRKDFSFSFLLFPDGHIRDERIGNSRA